jgi:hypothetical protein
MLSTALTSSCGFPINRGLKKSREVATVNKNLKEGHRRPLMRIVVSLMVGIPASADIYEIE